MLVKFYLEQQKSTKQWDGYLEERISNLYMKYPIMSEVQQFQL